jgi:filamentous hemagglutinin family protein
MLLCSSSLALVAGAVAAAPLPTGGAWVAGSGTIATHGSAMTITQSTATGIVDWNSFAIGKSKSVAFDNGVGATLNVVSGGAAHIAGELHATGSLFLMDAQGVVIDHTGRVVTGGGFVATSRMAGFGSDGRLALSGRAMGKVVNDGSISASDVRLNGRNTTNNGDVSVLRGGHIWLRGAGTTTNTGSLNAEGRGAIETSGHALNIGGTVDAGHGGTWRVDPTNLTVTSGAAATIDTSLNAGTNVTLKTTATGASGPGKKAPGAGDITVASAVTWGTSAKLTLDAYHSIIISKTVAVTGTGGLTLETDDGGTGGGLSFGGGNVTFANTGSALTINGSLYMLVSDMRQLANDIASTPSGDFALANSYDASGIYVAPISTTFGGTFEGLGNAVYNLNLAQTDTANFGLFKNVSVTGAVNDLTLTNLNLGSILAVTVVGGLVASDSGTLNGDSVSGTIAYQNVSMVEGGLVGTLQATGKVTNSSANVTLNVGKFSVGGALVGANFGTIMYSYAAGTATGNPKAYDVGGLVGDNEGTINYTYATTKVHGGLTVGGLAGLNNATIANTYATGSVKGNNGSAAGGLVGSDLSSGTITEAYATGAVLDTDPHSMTLGGLVGAVNGGQISFSFATGSVIGSGSRANIGGFAGLVQDGAIVSNSYATGIVSGSGTNASLGGFVGFAQTSTITDAYATGAISGNASQAAGGFAGAIAIGSSANTFTDDCWDVTTSGQNTGIFGTNWPNITGLTTAQIQSGLPSGFGSTVWAESSSINGGLPYLIANPPG